MKKCVLLITILFSLCINLFSQTISETQETNKPCIARLKVEFLATGKIGEVTPVSSDCNDKKYEQEAIKTAKNIRFDPQRKDGKAVTVVKTVEYSFTFFDEKAEAILKLALQNLGGNNLLQVKNQVSSGYFTVFRGGVGDLPNSFVDVISYPDKERTEFKQSGNKVIQTNSGEKGWIFDGGTQIIREQRPDEIENFKRGIRTSIDSLLRGSWRTKGATLSYVGKRQATLGKRNDVIKLTYSDGFAVEYEFSAEGMPMKSLYKKKNDEGEEILEEDRFAQFVDVQGVKVAFIVDHFSAGQQTSRINYDKIELNKKVPDTIFDKPSDVKQLKKDLKF